MDRAAAWLIIYSSVMAIAHHPRARENRNKVPLMRPDEAATIADDALLEYERRFGPRPEINVPPE
jgi:hypothetical protein